MDRQEGEMMKIGTVHHRLAYLAAGASALSVLLAGIAKLAGSILGLSPTSYTTLATVGILFAIYFLIEGVVYAAKKG